ncbi:MAG: TIGR01459 family HAD-type hydrolase [Pseudomonadota bacterium]
MQAPVRLSEIADQYEALLCDVWGVVRGGSSLVPEAIEALQRFRGAGGRVLLLSNSPRRPEALLAQLKQMGAPDDAFDGAATSGGAITAELTARAPGPAFRLGPEWDGHLYEGTGLEFAPLKDAEFISCTGLFDWEAETPDEYRDLLTEAKLRRLDMVCANPDIVVEVDGRLLYCAGALAQLYEELGGSVVYAGKPHPPIYDAAYRALEPLLKAPVDKDAILAIGDGPATDLAGAMAEGLDALFIADGIVSGDFRDGFDADRAAQLLADEGVTARYAAPKLVW